MINLKENYTALGSLPGELFDKDFGLTFGPSTGLLSEEAWETLEHCCEALDSPEAYENDYPGEGSQVFRPYRVEGQVAMCDLQQDQYGDKILQILSEGNLPSLVEQITGRAQGLQKFLVNTQFKGDSIEKHAHEENSLVAVLGVRIPKANTVPLVIERLTGNPPSEHTERYYSLDYEHQQPIDPKFIETQEVLIPHRGVLIMRGVWKHWMDPVDELRQTVGCFYVDR